MTTFAKRREVARKLAQAFSGHDPDTQVVPDFIQPLHIRGGFHAVPQQAAPLWTFFMGAAEAVMPKEGP